MTNLPSTWRRTQLRHLAKINNGADYRAVEVSEGGYPVYGSGGEFRRANSYLHDGTSVLFGRKGTVNKPLLVSGKFWTVDTMFYTVIEDSVDPRFLYYLATTIPYAYFQTNTAVPSITQADLAGHRIAVPDTAEQKRIADYLDRETAQIDALIAKQEQLIATLRERRSARLSELVTHGTDRNARRKASSLDWVDEVPAHWIELNIRRVAEMRTGHTPSRSVSEYWENTTIPWFTLADVWQLRDGSRTYVAETASKISDLGLANSAADLLPEGTVLLSRTASVGFSGIMSEPMATSQDFWNWVCGPRIVPEYLMYVFRAMRGHLLSLMIGSTHKTIYQPMAAALRIPLPPVEEQREIIAAVAEEIHQIDTLIAKAERFIALSKERRAALITAAVTGQLEIPG